MISKDKHKFSINPPESIDLIRKNQIEHSFIIPSDYVYFLLIYNGLDFDESPILKFKNDTFEFDEFNSLENIIWEINHYRKLSKIDNTSFWLEKYLCIGQLDDKRLLLGNNSGNLNKVFLYDNEGDYINILCDNIFQFINELLVYD